MGLEWASGCCVGYSGCKQTIMFKYLGFKWMYFTLSGLESVMSKRKYVFTIIWIVK